MHPVLGSTITSQSGILQGEPVDLQIAHESGLPGTTCSHLISKDGISFASISK